MDSKAHRFEFLDLTSASENERQILENILYNDNPLIILPSSSSRPEDDQNQWPARQFSDTCVSNGNNAEEACNDEVIQEVIEEDEVEEGADDDGTVAIEDANTGVRGGHIFHPHHPSYVVYYMTQFPPHPGGQYQYDVEPPPMQYQQMQQQQQQQQQQHRPPGPRSQRKNDNKKMEHPQPNYGPPPPPTPIQMVPMQYSTVFNPGAQFYHIAPPVYPDFHHGNFVEQNAPAIAPVPVTAAPVQVPVQVAVAPPPPPAAVVIPAPVPAPVVIAASSTDYQTEPEPIPVAAISQENPPINEHQQQQQQPDCTAAIPEFRTHEHMCYEENVTLKSPKKKVISTTNEEIKTKTVENVIQPEQSVESAAEPKSWAGLFNKPQARVSPYHRLSTNVAKQEQPAPVHSKNQHHSLVDDPYIIRLSEYLKGHQLDHRAANITPRGLINHSNWCYVNAILQAVIACPTFYNLLRGLPVPQNAEQAARIPITAAMIELAQCYASSNIGPRKKWEKHGRDDDLPTAPSFEPKGVYRVLEKVRSDSGYSVEGRQEDAEEFLSCLLNGLNDEMLEILKLVEGSGAQLSDSASSQRHDEPDEEDDMQAQHDGWKVMMPKNKKAITRRAVCGGSTPVSDIFRGQLRSHVQRAGDDASDSVQPFFTLQLDVEKAQSVKDALELLIGKDMLEGVTCTKTNKEVEAWTSSSIEDLPPILVLHLKCFDYKQDGCTKITKVIQFPIDLKIDAKLMSPISRNKYQIKQRNYKLVAVVYHDGKEASKGHYITDAYHVGLGAWIRYDDDNVRRVRVDQVLSPQLPRVPYLLYYRRTDTMSASSSNNKQSN